MNLPNYTLITQLFLTGVFETIKKKWSKKLAIKNVQFKL